MKRDLLTFAPKTDDVRLRADIRIGRALEEFDLAIACACSVDDAMKLRRYLSHIVTKGSALEQKALAKADELCDQPETPACLYCGKPVAAAGTYCDAVCEIDAERESHD